MNVINWLRTPIATLIVLCSALLAQLPHAADVFRLVVMGDGWGPTLHSYTYAVALELAVLLFVVQRRNAESYLFAGVSILVNLSYYHLHGVALWTIAAAPAWLISIALPAAIAQYSHLIAAATDAHAAGAGATPDAPAAHPRRAWWQFWRKDATLVAESDTPAALAVRGELHVADFLPAAAPAATWVDAVDDALAAIAQQDARTVALQMASEGVPVAQIAAQVDAKPATVRSWIARDRARRNGKAVQL